MKQALGEGRAARAIALTIAATCLSLGAIAFSVAATALPLTATAFSVVATALPLAGTAFTVVVTAFALAATALTIVVTGFPLAATAFTVVATALAVETDALALAAPALPLAATALSLVVTAFAFVATAFAVEADALALAATAFAVEADALALAATAFAVEADALALAATAFAPTSTVLPLPPHPLDPTFARVTPSPPPSPLPGGIPVEQARDAYLLENGFTVEAYDAKYTEASFLGIKLRVPNTRHHAWAIQRHDLHHVATGYGTDLVGEGEISAWELARGLRGLGAYVGSIVLAGAAAGLLFAPRRTLRAWRASRRAGCPDSLFQSQRPYPDLLAMSVGDLRRELGVPQGGTAEHPRRLHAYAPALSPTGPSPGG